MFARVIVTLKNGVLDPQGRVIHRAAATAGYEGIEDVRQGKYFELQLDPRLSAQGAQILVEKLAQELLANPVVEQYQVEVVRENDMVETSPAAQNLEGGCHPL
ncbi:MAG: phosphoribosylformylglycinamidine synthase subunit PurS [Acidobacteria bacterium]|nr:phosphoribosylformylglycinamidine synthase subunit PurS [Acidobacteriota bacterium]